jgi:hypothetical protein
MRFNICSNLNNGVGLQRDYELLRHQLEKRGHQVYGVQFNATPVVAPRADVNIFVEVVTPFVFAAAPKQWVIPHPEWWFAQWDKYPYDLVLAKTRDCERIFRAKVGDKCRYIGWLARDLYRPEIPRQRKFLHVCGKSQFKNTPAVIVGCQHAGVPLTVIGTHAGTRRHVSDPELVNLMNTHFCQVMPSAYEGYGHVLHEALGAGQILITTNAPPMNELTPSILLPSESTSKYHEGTLHKVSPLSVSKAVKHVMALPPTSVQRYRDEGRAQFQQDQVAFEQALDELLGPG